MKKLLSFALLLVFLSGCIDYHEKMKINDDGSGEITFAVGVSESLFNLGDKSGDLNNFEESKIRKNFESKPGIKLIGTRTYASDGDKWIEVHLLFKTLEALNKAANDSSEQAMLGNSTLTKDTNGNLVFTKTITSNNNQSQSDSTSNETSKGMMEMMFGKYKWNYELTVPGKIISTNAEQNDINHNTNTVKWSLSMASLSQPKILTVTFQQAGLSNLTLIILAVIAVVVLTIVFLYRIKNK